VKVWVDRLIRDGVVARSRLFECDSDGRVISDDIADPPSDALKLGIAVPGFANAHSHAFHRALRGRTHTSGTFWTWREAMYRAARRLTPQNYRRLAAAVFEEMLAAGWTTVGEFHYVHHDVDGAHYGDHDMERALADAALEVGIRLVILDTCYLTGGIGQRLSPEQRRFGDGSASRWLDRWFSLKAALEDAGSAITLGAAVHSVRAVPADDLRTIADELPAEVPLHVHLSEQPAENEQSILAYGKSPTRVLSDAGLLAPRLSVVHATHLTPDDIALLGDSGAYAVFCPSTEADLGDGIGPARELTDAGVSLSIGSDQNAVIDPWLELRGLESGERLRTRQRGRFTPAELMTIGASGYQALGMSRPLTPGGYLDLVEMSPLSERTAGTRWEEVAMTATAADVMRTVVGGQARSSEPSARAHRLRASIAEIWESDLV
jgi:formiminoglutamate deiminase